MNTLLTVMLAFLTSGGATAASGPGPKWSVTTLEGGIPLVHVQAASASPVSSVRLVVRAGAFQDLLGKSGTAHVVQHLVLAGNHEITEEMLWRETRAKEANYHGHTSSEMTVFGLDAPHDDFVPLMGTFTRLVTDPAFRLARYAEMRSALATDRPVFPWRTVLDAMDMRLYADHAGEEVLGTLETRNIISLEDVIAYYARYYVPSNVRILVVSKASVAEVKGMLEKTFLLPPEDQKPPAQEHRAPKLPVQQKANGHVAATLVGYRLGADKQNLCRVISRLAEYRLHERMLTKEPVFTSVRVDCHCTRGERFLVAVGLTRNQDGGNPAQALEESLTSLASKKPGTDEVKSMTARYALVLDGKKDDSAALANDLARVLGERDEIEAAVTEELSPLRPDWPAMEKLMKESFKERNRVVIQFAPAAG